jgi:hypothetical protein
VYSYISYSSFSLFCAIVFAVLFSLLIEAMILTKINKIEHNFNLDILPYLKIVKGRAVPLQAWNGPDGSRKLRFPDFMKTAQGGGKVVSLTHRPPLPPGNTPGTHFC